MDSDEDSGSKRDYEWPSAKRIQSDIKSKKGPSDLKALKTVGRPQESTGNQEYFDSMMASTDPEDISKRTLASFEGYLAHVNSMYFEHGSLQDRPGLNEVSSRISSTQKGIPVARADPVQQASSDPSKSWLDFGITDFHYTTLDVLWNPLRVSHVFEDWSPREIAIFETWICKFGKNFHEFPKFLRTKSTREVVDFYYCWKMTSRFKVWQQKMESYVSDDLNDWIY